MIEVFVIVCVGMCAGLIASHVVLLNFMKKGFQKQEELMKQEVNKLTRMMVSKGVGDEYFLAIRSLVLSKYGRSLDNTDVTTLLIKWNKTATASADFMEYLENYLKDKQWQLF